MDVLVIYEHKFKTEYSFFIYLLHICYILIHILCFMPLSGMIADIIASTGDSIGMNILFVSAINALVYATVWIIVRMKNSSSIG